MGSVECSKCHIESISVGWGMVDGEPVCNYCLELEELEYELSTK